MQKRSDTLPRPQSEPDWDTLRDRVVGMGERSLRKNYFPELRKKLTELERFRTLINRSQDMIFLIDLIEKRVLEGNPAAARGLNYEIGVLEGVALRDIDESLDDQDRLDHLFFGPKNGASSVRSYFRRRDGMQVPVELSVGVLPKGAEPVGVLIARDITSRLRDEAEIAHLASHDPITDLPNRRQLLGELGDILARGGVGLVSFVAVDGLNRVRDALGHPAVDTLLKAVGDRLVQALGEKAIVASWGNGEFVMVTESPNALGATGRACSLFERPFVIDGRERTVTCRIGTSVFPDDGTDPDMLVRRAALALVHGRSASACTVSSFFPELETVAARRYVLETDLRAAIGSSQLTLHYQPKIDLATGVMMGAEALVRWFHPTLGPISPVDFIPVAEETGLIVPLGEWVFQTACEQARRWADMGARSFNMAINVSGRQFDVSDLRDFVQRIIADTRVSAQNIEIEVTESCLMDAIDNGREMLGALKSLGVGIAIDDFGTGYSSLSYLRKLPLDTLKIDRSFVCDLEENVERGESGAIARTIIAMARALDLKVVAEGVETNVQREFLTREGCDIGQGYLFAKPLAVPEATDFLFRQVLRA